jgi:hypothetical protein
MKQIGFWAGGALLLALAVSPVKVASGVSNEEMLKKLVQYLKVIEPALAKPGGLPPTRENLLALIQKASPKISEIEASGILHMIELVYPDRGIPPYVAPTGVRRASEPPPQIRPPQKPVDQVLYGRLPPDEETLRQQTLSWVKKNGKQLTDSEWIQWFITTYNTDAALAVTSLGKLKAYDARVRAERRAAAQPTVERAPVAVPPPPLNVPLPPLPPAGPPPPPRQPGVTDLSKSKMGVSPALPPRQAVATDPSKPKVDLQKKNPVVAPSKVSAEEFTEQMKKLRPTNKESDPSQKAKEEPVAGGIADIMAKAMDKRRKALKEDVEAEEELRPSGEWEQ